MTEPTTIPSTGPAVEGREIEYVRKSIESGHTSSGRTFSRRGGRDPAGRDRGRRGAAHDVVHGRARAARDAARPRPGDTVIVPSFTFTTTALAFARAGRRILFCDIEPDTLGLDPAHLAELLDDTSARSWSSTTPASPATSAGIRAVLADRPDVAVIEDNAHGLFGALARRAARQPRPVRHPELPRDQELHLRRGRRARPQRPRDVDRARVLYDKGTNRQAFFLGQVDKYSWRDTGSSFGLSDTLAAYLLGPARAARVDPGASAGPSSSATPTALAPDADELGLRLPVSPTTATPAYHLFYVLLPDQRPRARDAT